MSNQKLILVENSTKSLGESGDSVNINLVDNAIIKNIEMCKEKAWRKIGTLMNCLINYGRPVFCTYRNWPTDFQGKSIIWFPS